MTLTYSEIMVRYGELSTKGKNRMRFINKLRNNIKDVLSIYPEVKVTFELKGETKDGYVRLSAADFDQEVFEEFKQTAAEQAFTVTDYSSNSLEGTVDASDNQTLFLSIPYDSGWKVKVDGKEVKTCRIGDAFLGVKVPSGEHTVSLKYTPPGFSIGWKVSLAAAIIFIVLCFVKYRYKADIKKKE